jgi:hypothetical protein
MPQTGPRIELERIEEAVDLAESSAEDFDRIAFAERAIALIRPPRTAVAICEGGLHARVHVESGRQWGTYGGRWAVVRVPRRASRRAIASAVLGLYGTTDEMASPYRAHRAWALDVLMTELGRS